MAFEKFNKDMKIISALDDEPNDVGGLTAAELKAKFDEGGEAIKRYLNDTLIPAVVEDGATEEHRAAAEAARVAAEQTRQSNEATRQANETSRISAENARSVWENYDASKTYAVGNKVAYGGSSYLCIKPCTGIAPPSAEYWLLIAKKGDKGDKGEPGGGGGGGGQPAVEIDLSDSITMDFENSFVSHIEVGYDKSVGEEIKRAALAGSAKVTVLLKVGVGEPEKVTLQMFGTQSALEDGTPTYALTGTYVFSGVFPMDIMIGTIIYETDCTVVRRIDSAGDKPIYDPVDKPDTTPDGAFLRWSGEQKKWVAEKVDAKAGAYQFSVNDDGDLILTYEGDQPPQYAINNDGDLILTTADGNTINLGRVKGGTDISLGLTAATVGQTVKVKAVDTDGKPTAWEAVDMAGGGVEWYEVIDTETAEVVNDLTITTDKNGRPISGYHALAMVLCFMIPADSTQTSNNGNVWVYPVVNNELSHRLRIVQTIATWKSFARTRNCLYAGSNRAMFLSGDDGLAVLDVDYNDVFNGVRLYVHEAGDHLPIGTKVRCLVLSKGWEA